MVTDFFLFIFHPFVFFFLFVEAARELKTERKKTRIPLNSIFIFGFYAFFWCGTFSWTTRNGRASQSRYIRVLRRYFWQIVNHRCRVKGIRGSFWQIVNLRVSRYIQLTVLWAVNTMRCSTGGLSSRGCSKLLLREKGTSLSWCMSRRPRKNFLAPRNPSFEACADCTSYQRPLGSYYFWIYLFISFHVYLIFVIVFFFKFLI